jgi:methylated-DNA-[protein]-cysteine S-methyltransferase
MMYAQKVVPSPIGPLRLFATDAALGAVMFANDRLTPPPSRAVEAHPVLDLAARELAEYFTGARRTFTTPLDAAGTEFQRAVWRALLDIPFGETRSYADVARALGRPSAVRAVGAANGRNPLPIIVPCHRVIGTDGSLTGFGGGLPAKRWLLGHERG